MLESLKQTGVGPSVILKHLNATIQLVKFVRQRMKLSKREGIWYPMSYEERNILERIETNLLGRRKWYSIAKQKIRPMERNRERLLQAGQLIEEAGVKVMIEKLKEAWNKMKDKTIGTSPASLQNAMKLLYCTAAVDLELRGGELVGLKIQDVGDMLNSGPTEDGGYFPLRIPFHKEMLIYGPLCHLVTPLEKPLWKQCFDYRVEVQHADLQQQFFYYARKRSCSKDNFTNKFGNQWLQQFFHNKSLGHRVIRRSLATFDYVINKEWNRDIMLQYNRSIGRDATAFRNEARYVYTADSTWREMQKYALLRKRLHEEAYNNIEHQEESNRNRYNMYICISSLTKEKNCFR